MKKVILVILMLAVPVCSYAQNGMNVHNKVNELMEVYDLWNQAQKSGDIDEMMKYVSKDAKAKMDADMKGATEEEFDTTAKMLQAMAPITYTKWFWEFSVDGKKAVLNLQAVMKPFGGESGKVKGEISFVKENGEWKIDSEKWESWDDEKDGEFAGDI